MGNLKTYLINQIVKYSLKLDQKGFTANHDGNISVKYHDQYLITPTSISKGNIEKEMVLTLDSDGNKLEGVGKPFSELKLHFAAYNAREEAVAVVHAHPAFSMARGLVQKSFDINIPEAVVSLGDLIPVSPFMMPGAKESDDIVYDMLQQADIFMIPGNGVLAIGETLELAYLRIELLEHLIKIDHYARQMGTPMTLSFDDKSKLLEKRRSIGLGPKGDKKVFKPKDNNFISQNSSLKNLIAEEIKNVLKGDL